MLTAQQMKNSKESAETKTIR